MRRRQIMAQAARPPVAAPKPDLASLYEKAFGKKPHWKMKPETMLERLREHGHAV